MCLMDQSLLHLSRNPDPLPPPTPPPSPPRPNSASSTGKAQPAIHGPKPDPTTPSPPPSGPPNSPNNQLQQLDLISSASNFVISCV
ncbi:hypothetical protein AA0115_g6502 [Alternaria tenuissima]|uniref:Uncharacterized protein n=1 Tax=Alternaria tenuissima TaxID=119927 RepID=A0AB37WGS5_9PLEO|nr:hypothetical protein AA0115_g6502 [Alternaria tenuissima]